MADKLKVLVIGSGGREHAICWKISQSPLLAELHAAPGNPGIGQHAQCHTVKADDITGLVALTQKLQIDLVVVGPEIPLAAGLVDTLRVVGIRAFGPDQAGAQLESSKVFMKDLCSRAGVPTARYARFTDVAAAQAYLENHPMPAVIKADGLAAGKGVIIAQTKAEAQAAVHIMLVDLEFGAAGSEIVIEEFLAGEEISFFALCSGRSTVAIGAAQDHKRAFDGDQGPNTGGMGTYAPVPWWNAELEQQALETMVQPTLDAMAMRGTPFTGILFAGLMIDRINTIPAMKLLEFNTRFGDPETQVILPRLQDDLLALFDQAARGHLPTTPLTFTDQAAVCIVYAANGYPGDYVKNTVIQGADNLQLTPDSLLFHAGTTQVNGQLQAYGGRVLNIVGLGADLTAAKAAAYQAISKINWPDGFYRKDIGHRAA